MTFETFLSNVHSSRPRDAPNTKMLVPEQRFLIRRRCACFRPSIPISFGLGNLFRELLGLLLGLSTELLGLVDDGVGALLGLLCSLAELALDGGNAVLCLELESLLAATHAVTLLAINPATAARTEASA